MLSVFRNRRPKYRKIDESLIKDMLTDWISRQLSGLNGPIQEPVLPEHSGACVCLENTREYVPCSANSLPTNTFPQCDECVDGCGSVPGDFIAVTSHYHSGDKDLWSWVMGAVKALSASINCFHLPGTICPLFHPPWSYSHPPNAAPHFSHHDIAVTRQCSINTSITTVIPFPCLFFIKCQRCQRSFSITSSWNISLQLPPLCHVQYTVGLTDHYRHWHDC